MNSETVFTIVAALWTLTTFIISRRTEKNKTLREYNKDIQIWANVAIDLMTSASHLCKINPALDNQFFDKRQNILIALSAHIDKGRLFFPNTGTDEHGHHKPSAYRGFRSAALNHLTNCYKLVDKISYKEYEANKDIKELIITEKRHFVSVIQEKLDPNAMEEEVKRIF
jgi:hypothetical protein